MAKRLIPTFNRILVEKIVPPSKTSAGILLPEKSSQLNSGKVIAVGPGSRDKTGNFIPVSVKEGDRVLLPEYGGTQIKLDDKEIYKLSVSLKTLKDRFSSKNLIAPLQDTQQG
ncbi:unnamed protein product [Sphenostylis stenocarpa]|uniref:Protein groES n=1 Tax=Sphenostylis stenocarpa TaxID=92480 RepID=A0AA86S2J7_9FABA|nr:unnamed protein product [Sphenostylis stenocarpa]